MCPRAAWPQSAHAARPPSPSGSGKRSLPQSCPRPCLVHSPGTRPHAPLALVRLGCRRARVAVSASHSLRALMLAAFTAPTAPLWENAELSLEGRQGPWARNVPGMWTTLTKALIRPPPSPRALRPCVMTMHSSEASLMNTARHPLCLPACPRRSPPPSSGERRERRRRRRRLGQAVRRRRPPDSRASPPRRWLPARACV